MKSISEELTNYRAILSESKVAEAWDKKLDTADKDKGMWKGWTLAELKAELKKLKDNPKKTETLKKREKQVEFAIRAKQKNKFGKIKESSEIDFSKYDAIKRTPQIDRLSVPDKHKLRIAMDTVKNPAKALMGYPSVEEAKDIIFKLTGRRVTTPSDKEFQDVSFEHEPEELESDNYDMADDHDLLDDEANDPFYESVNKPWTCKECENHNFVHMKTCKHCGEAKPKTEKKIEESTKLNTKPGPWGKK